MLSVSDYYISGNRYIAVFTDYFSKWVEAEAIKDKSAESVNEVFMRFVSIHGCPKVLITDQGREFCNQLNDRICLKLGIDHRIASSYHPQTGGQTERFNRTLSSMLGHYVNKSQNDWDKKLPFVLFAYRTSKHSSTKQTPFYLVYGRAPRLPIELDTLPSVEETQDSYEDKLNKRCDSFLQLAVNREQASVEIKRAQAIQKKYHDSKIDVEQFKPGDKVLLHNTRLTTRKGGKLEKRWKGPFTITEAHSHGTYTLDGQKVAVNGSRLKLFQLDEYTETHEEQSRISEIPPIKRKHKIMNDHQLPLKKRKTNIDDPQMDVHIVKEEQGPIVFKYTPVDESWQKGASDQFQGHLKMPIEPVRRDMCQYLLDLQRLSQCEEMGTVYLEL